MKDKEEILRRALAGVPEGTILEERIRLALAMEEVKIAIREALGPIPVRAVYLLARILNFFRRGK